MLLLVFSFLVDAKPSQQEWVGMASYYHIKFHGRKTASGEIFDNQKLTAANNFLKLGTIVKVTNLKNKQSVVVIINDRMARHNKRLIDLSEFAAKQLGYYNHGLCKVKLELANTHEVKFFKAALSIDSTILHE